MNLYEYSWAYVLGPCAFFMAYMYYFVQRRKEIRALFQNKVLQQQILPQKVLRQRHLKMLCLCISLWVLAFALREGHKHTNNSESEILLVLDNSLSMLAEDIVQDPEPPTHMNRFDKAKEMIRTLLSTLDTQHKVGFIVMSKTAQIECPPTHNRELLIHEYVQNAMIAPSFKQGTQLSAALDQALWLFEGTQSTHKTIILYSDGEDHNSQIEESITKLINKKIHVFTIGLGSTTGAPIPLYQDEARTHKTSLTGEQVLSKRNDTLLKYLAKQTNGKYYPIEHQAAQIDLPGFHTDSLTHPQHTSTTSQGFILSTCLLCILALCISEKRHTHSSVASSASVIGLILISTHTLTNAQQHLDSLHQGNTAFHNQNYQKAIENYQKALKTTTDSNLRSQLYYNLGRAFQKRGNLDQALESYKNVLTHNPKHQAARYYYYFLKKHRDTLQSQNQSKPSPSPELHGKKPLEYFKKEFLDMLMQNKEKTQDFDTLTRLLKSPDFQNKQKELAQRNRMNRYQLIQRSEKELLFSYENDW